MKDTGKARADLVNHQIVARGFVSRPVVAAMRRVPREKFVPWKLKSLAYPDGPRK